MNAARDLLSLEGFRGVSVRDVASRAGVDPALIYRYFPSKEELFIEALRQSFAIIRDDTGPPGVPFEGLGELVVARFLRTWGTPRSSPLIVTLLRAASENQKVEKQLRDYIQSTIIPATREHVGSAARTRAPLVGSVLMGLGVMRHLLHIEPFASMSDDEVARLAGRLITNILRGEHEARPSRT